MADDLLAGFRVEEAEHGFFDLIDEFVDDGVELDLDAFRFGGFDGFALEFDAEADDDGVCGGGEEDIVFGDRADACEDEVEADLIGFDIAQLGDEGFEGALDVGFEDEFEDLALTVFCGGEEGFEGGASWAAEFFETSGFGAFFAEAFGAAFVFHFDEFLADAGEASEADDLDWGGGAGFLDGLAAVIEHAFDLA